MADVTRTASGLKLLGNISYTLGVFYQTLLLKTHNLTMLADGKRIETRNVFVEISNTRYTANFLMAPNAEIDDGFLDVTLLGKVSRRRLLSCFPKMFTGDHIHMEEVDHFKAKHLSIVTDKPKVLSPDGEIYRESDAILEISRQMPGIYSAFRVFKILPRTMRDGIYRWVAKNRYRWFGKQDVCRVPTANLQAKFL